MKRVAICISLVTTVAAACSSTTDDVITSCIVGTKRSCDFGPECAIALQECASNPPVWGTCECTLFRPPAAEASVPDADAGPRILGQSCRGDTECSPGAFCLTRASHFLFGGGPPKGVCVADCSADPSVCRTYSGATCVTVAPNAPASDAGHDAAPKLPEAGNHAGADATTDAGHVGAVDAGSDAAFDAHPDALPHEAGHLADAGADARMDVDAGDASRVVSPTALCFKSCTPGPNPELLSKCSSVPHVACQPLQSDSGGYCRPICATDADCAENPLLNGPARVCDVRSSTCVDVPTTGGSTLGMICDPAEAGACDGTCVPISHATDVKGVQATPADGGSRTGAAYVCSERCPIGEPIDCGGSKAGKFEGACLSEPEGRASGDVGYCRKLCDCSKDCPLDSNQKPQACVPFGDPSFDSSFGRRGTCMPAALVSGTTLTCP